MTIRKMEINDLKVICDIEKQLYPSFWSENFFIQDLNNKYAHYYVLEEDKIIGYYGVWIVDDFATITKVSIDKPYQGKGLANKLMDHLIDLCKENDCAVIDLEVRESNNVAKSLYEKYGFKVVRKIKDYYPNEDGLNMNKVLKEGENYEKVYSCDRK